MVRNAFYIFRPKIPQNRSRNKKVIKKFNSVYYYQKGKIGFIYTVGQIKVAYF